MTFKELTDLVRIDLSEKNDTPTNTKIKSYINRGYRELAKREGLASPIALSLDTDTPLTNIKNEEFIINYAKYQYLLADSLEDLATIYKNEYEGMKLIKNFAFVRIVDVYNSGLGVEEDD